MCVWTGWKMVGGGNDPRNREPIRKMNGKFPAAVNRLRRCRVDHDQLMRLTIHQEQLVITQNLEPIFAIEGLAKKWGTESVANSWSQRGRGQPMTMSFSWPICTRVEGQFPWRGCPSAGIAEKAETGATIGAGSSKLNGSSSTCHRRSQPVRQSR